MNRFAGIAAAILVALTGAAWSAETPSAVANACASERAPKNVNCEEFLAGEIDIRSIDMPRWILFSSIGAGFTLIGIEFLVLLLGRGSLYRGDEQQRGIV